MCLIIRHCAPVIQGEIVPPKYQAIQTIQQEYSRHPTTTTFVREAQSAFRLVSNVCKTSPISVGLIIGK